MTGIEREPLDPVFVVLADSVAAAGLPPIAESDVDEVRARVEAGDATQRPGPDCSVDDRVVTDSSVPVRIYTPDQPVDGAVLYAHGGGWVLGGLGYGDEFCRLLAVASRRVVVSVDYRRAPEHRYPAALDDCWDVYRWAVSAFGGNSGVAVAGDSAGGNLAAALCHRAERLGEPAPRAQILLYPVLDDTMNTQSYRDNARGPLLTAADMAWFWDQYIPDPLSRIDPEAAPARAREVSASPPALIVACAHDPLYDEAVEYAGRLDGAGVRTVLRTLPSMPHGVVRFTGVGDSVAEVTESIVQDCVALLGRE